MDYPEHEKLQKVRGQSETVGAFLEWLESQGVALCLAHQHNEHCENDDGEWPKYICGCHQDEYMPEFKSIETRLAEFFEIDLKKLSAEKDAMLQEIRGAL